MKSDLVSFSRIKHLTWTLNDNNTLSHTGKLQHLWNSALYLCGHKFYPQIRILQSLFDALSSLLNIFYYIIRWCRFMSKLGSRLRYGTELKVKPDVRRVPKDTLVVLPPSFVHAREDHEAIMCLISHFGTQRGPRWCYRCTLWHRPHQCRLGSSPEFLGDIVIELFSHWVHYGCNLQWTDVDKQLS